MAATTHNLTHPGMNFKVPVPGGMVTKVVPNAVAPAPKSIVKPASAGFAQRMAAARLAKGKK